MADNSLPSSPTSARRLLKIDRMVRDLQIHAQEHGWQDVDEPIAALLAWECETEPDASSPPSEDEQCPVCGYYCLGRGGVGCIDKPSMQQPSSPTSEGREEFKGHTPGPWVGASVSGCKRIRGGKSGSHKQAQRKDLAWTVGLSSEAEDAANARLIAAAPDLLRENTELRASLTETQAQIESFWRECSLRYDIETREFFEREHGKVGFDTPIAMAMHHIWKREPRVTETQAEIERLKAATAWMLRKLQNHPEWRNEFYRRAFTGGAQ